MSTDNILAHFRAALTAMDLLDAEADELCTAANETGIENAELDVSAAADQEARKAARLAAEILGGGAIRYGYVDYHAPDRPTAEGVAGRWRFRLSPEVTNFAEAWEAAVLDFAADADPWRDAKVREDCFNYADLIDYPHILTRHGLTHLPDDETAPTVLVDLDTILVDPEDEGGRCLHSQDGEYCGTWLGGVENGDRCEAHPHLLDLDTD